MECYNELVQLFTQNEILSWFTHSNVPNLFWCLSTVEHKIDGKQEDSCFGGNKQADVRKIMCSHVNMQNVGHWLRQLL